MDPLREYENIKNHLARRATKKMLEKNYLLTYQKSRARARSAAVHSTRSVSFDKHVEYSFKKKGKGKVSKVESPRVGIRENLVRRSVEKAKKSADERQRRCA